MFAIFHFYYISANLFLKHKDCSVVFTQCSYSSKLSYLSDSLKIQRIFKWKINDSNDSKRFVVSYEPRSQWQRLIATHFTCLAVKFCAIIAIFDWYLLWYNTNTTLRASHSTKNYFKSIFCPNIYTNLCIDIEILYWLLK